MRLKKAKTEVHRYSIAGFTRTKNVTVERGGAQGLFSGTLLTGSESGHLVGFQKKNQGLFLYGTQRVLFIWNTLNIDHKIYFATDLRGERRGLRRVSSLTKTAS